MGRTRTDEDHESKPLGSCRCMSVMPYSASVEWHDSDRPLALCCSWMNPGAILSARHHLIKTVHLYDFKRCLEQRTEMGRREDLRLQTIRNDYTLFQQYNARD